MLLRQVTHGKCSVDGQSCRAQWPRNIAHGLPPNSAIIVDSALPSDWEMLDGLLKVERRQTPSLDSSRRSVVCSQASEDQQPVEIHLWGFVKEVSMGSTGSWNGYVPQRIPTFILQLILSLYRKPDTAARAMRSVSLHSGGCEVAFAAQIQLVNAIREYVAVVLQGGPPSLAIDRIDVLHKVFRKVGAYGFSLTVFHC